LKEQINKIEKKFKDQKIQYIGKSKEEQILEAHLKILTKIGEDDEKYKSILHIIENTISNFVHSS